MTTESFSREQRLRNNLDIRRVLKSGRARRFQWVDVYTLPNASGFSRICVVVSGKVTYAAKRNRIKRLFKEAFRTAQPVREACLDIVVVMRKWRADISLHLAKDVLNAIIEK